jgi:hypothetical protein
LNIFSAVKFFLFLAIKTLDPESIRIGIQPNMLDPDPYQNEFGSEKLEYS